MSYPTEALKEHPSAYFVEDRDNLEEIARLIAQDAMLTAGMGGLLPEQGDTQHICSVLDVGCGTGDWLIAMATTYPTMTRLVGVDISSKVLAYPRKRVEEQHLTDRVEFQTMDALRLLDFHKESFDLVNQRLGISWIRIHEWTKILLEYQRVTRTGGIIRITESVSIESSSPALTTLCALVLEASFYSGRLFTRTNEGAIRQLVLLMKQHDIEDVQTHDYFLVYTAGTPEHQVFFADMQHLFCVVVPFIRKWTRVPATYEQTYQQALKEMQEPDFVATWHVCTVWGKATEQGKRLRMRGLR
jgi:ubiquinone/menaquinone biosynthesis C-methylase UbiE